MRATAVLYLLFAMFMLPNEPAHAGDVSSDPVIARVDLATAAGLDTAARDRLYRIGLLVEGVRP